MRRRKPGRPRGSVDRCGSACRVDGTVLDLVVRSFGEQIRHVREDANVSASELALAIGMSTATVHRYEKHRSSIPLRSLVAIAMALRVPVEHLVPEV